MGHQVYCERDGASKIKLPYCLIALLPYCLIALLPYCLIALLPCMMDVLKKN